jgi:cysteine desulfurase
MGIFDPTRLESGIALESREYRATGLELRHPAPGSKPRAIYLDANATAPLLKPVVDAVMDAMLSEVGNPASAHANGTAARRLMETARDRVSELVPGFEPENIIFVSGGTEANNTVIGSFVGIESVTFLAAPIEHSSVVEPLRIRRPERVVWLEVDSMRARRPG